MYIFFSFFFFFSWISTSSSWVFFLTNLSKHSYQAAFQVSGEVHKINHLFPWFLWLEADRITGLPIWFQILKSSLLIFPATSDSYIILCISRAVFSYKRKYSTRENNAETWPFQLRLYVCRLRVALYAVRTCNIAKAMFRSHVYFIFFFFRMLNNMTRIQTHFSLSQFYILCKLPLLSSDMP